MDKKIMHTSDGKAEYLAQYVVDGARINEEHVGHRLMASLTKQIADRVRDTDFNPVFIDDMDYDGVVNWLNDHIVFNASGAMIGLFDGSEWLWEADRHAG